MFLFLNKWLLLCCTVILITAARPALLHPYHVSATEMEYNASSKKIEITTKVFTDDFEAVLAKIYKTKVDLDNADMKPAMTALIKKYITDHLAVKSEGKYKTLQLYGWETDHEAVYIYTTADATAFNKKDILIENTVLYDQFDDQVNITHFTCDGARKSYKLNYPERKWKLGF